MGEEGSLVQEAETPYVILMASEPAVLAVVAHAVLLGWRGGMTTSISQITPVVHPEDRSCLHYPQLESMAISKFLHYQKFITKFPFLLHLVEVGWLVPAKDCH